jgi:hypothetical protein
MWSGVAVCRIVLRNTALTESAIPASTNSPNAGHSSHRAPPSAAGPGDRPTTTPKTAMLEPQATIAVSTAKP